MQENMKIQERGYSLRNLKDGQVKVPNKGKKSCTGFSYTGPKFWNHLPSGIITTEIRETFQLKLDLVKYSINLILYFHSLLLD